MEKEVKSVVVMFPYPSGSGLHVGHWYNYAIIDSYCRYKRYLGEEIFQPIGFDAFGLPAENYALKVGRDPKEVTYENIEKFKKQIEGMNTQYEMMLNTCDSGYISLTQELFLRLLEKGLAYKAFGEQDYCPSCKTVLAREQVKAEKCERCETKTTKKKLLQWYFKITEYKQRLIDNLEHLDYPESTKKQQREWLENLHDWCVSRQRKWGCPIPIEGETDTLDTFVDSSFYFITYQQMKGLKPKPIDLYVGGSEHACMHLIYARFITMFLYDEGVIDFEEPFKKLIHQGMILKDGQKMSKCFSKNTEILMFDGTVKYVQDIVVGDMVMGVDSLPRIVQHTTFGKDEMFKIYRGGKNSNRINEFNDEYEVNKDHILVLKSGDKRRYKIDGDYHLIKLEDYLNFSQKKKSLLKGVRSDGIDFKTKKVKIDPYILGVWLGDGSRSDSSFTTKDIEIKNAITKEAENRSLIVKEYKKENNSASYFKITTGLKSGGKGKNSFITDLRYYNLFKNKHVPFDYSINSEEVRLNLLAGLIDTDGHIVDRGNYEFSNKNKSIAMSVVFISRSLGLRATISEFIDKKYNDKYYRVFISGNTEIIPVRIKRKKVLKSKIKKENLYKLNIESVGTKEYFGFSVDKDNLFLLKDFTIVHNSKGNVVNLDDYDSDEIRFYLMFLGHYFDGGSWSDQNIIGVRRFINRMRDWVNKEGEDEVDLEGLKKQVFAYTESFKFNKVVSSFMIFFNENKKKNLTEKCKEELIDLISLYMPNFRLKMRDTKN